ncbi:hypothetical protein [Rosistilla oblonga]|uniref:hypothetical protein n=1 Tax=Rosistilla oblonga TaxID=2527990 RepID=UPI003A980736
MRTLLTLALLLTTAGLSTQVSAQYPIGHLRAIQPPVIQVDQPTKVRLVGSDLVDIDRLWFSDPAITAALQTRPGKAFAAEATEPDYGHFEVTAKAKPGVYEVRADGFHGSSNPLRLIVTDLPVVTMPADTSTLEKAAAATLPCWVTGTVRASGFAYIAFQLDSKDPIVIEAAAGSIDSASELEIEVLDESGRRLVRAATDPTREDPVVLFTPPAPGKYYLAIADHLFAGGDNAFFAIKLHRGPVVRWVQPIAAKANTETTITLTGLGLEEPMGKVGPWQTAQRTITAPESAVATPPVGRPTTATMDRFLDDTLRVDGHSIALTDVDVNVEQEPNDSHPQAMPIAIDSEVSGIFAAGRDADWYRFDAKKDQTVKVDLFASRLGQTCDPVLGIFRVDTAADGKQNAVQVQFFDDHPARDKERTNPYHRSSVDPSGAFKADRDGPFYIRVGDQFSAANDGPPIQYRLTLRTPRPQFRAYALVKQLRIDNANHYPSNSLAVRKGETIPLVVEVDREDFAGEIQVAAAGLPDGIIARPSIISAGENATTLLLSAAEQAAFEATPITVTATATMGDTEFQTTAIPVVCVGPSANVTTTAAAARTTSTLMLSLAGDSSHASVDLTHPEATPQVKPEETHTVKCNVTRRMDFKTPLKFKAIGLAANWKVPEITLDEKTATADYAIPVPKDAKPGVYDFYLQSDAAVSVIPNQPAHARAVAYRKHLDTVEQATKTERAAEQDPEKQKALDAKLAQITAAKAAADKEIAALAKPAGRKTLVQSQPYRIEVVAK